MTASNVDELKKRATRAIIAYSFFRLESAVTIGGSILLAFFLPSPFFWWQWWYWLALGGLFESLIFYTSMSDQRTGQRVVAGLLRESYNPGEIKTRKYREKIEQALAYREQIEKVIAATPMGLLRDHLGESTAGISYWMGQIFAIAQRLDAFEHDVLIHQDMQGLPANIQRLRQSLSTEDDPAVSQQIKATLAAIEAQNSNLNALSNQMEQAELRLEETVAALGTVYSQFQLVHARKMDRLRAKDLSQDISTQVQGLEDILDSMDKVYGQP